LLDAILAVLSASPLIKEFQIEELDKTPEGDFLLKVRCRLLGGQFFQIRIRHTFSFTRYAYQMFTDAPLFRWDNVPHYPQLDNFPHHFHRKQDAPVPSNLIGNPVVDLSQVLKEADLLLSECQNL